MIGKNLPYISVVVTAYNRQAFLSKALESLKNQELISSNFEIIILTNFDLNIPIMQELLENGINLIFLKIEGSIGAFYKKAVEVSNGEILCFLDDDDSFSADKLYTVYEIFKNNNQIGYYSNYINIIDEFDNSYEYRIKIGNVQKKRVKKEIIINSESDWKSIERFIAYGGNAFNSTISIRKSILEKYINVLKFTTRAEDEVLFFIALDSGYNLMLNSLILTNYRILTSSATRISFKSTSNLSTRCNALQKELNTFNSLLTSKNMLEKEITQRCLISSYTFVSLFHSSICTQFNSGNCDFGLMKSMKILFFKFKLVNLFLFFLYCASRFKKNFAIKLYFIFRGD